MIEAVYSQIPFEREQLASSKGEDISDQVYRYVPKNEFCTNLGILTFSHDYAGLIGMGEFVV